MLRDCEPAEQVLLRALLGGLSLHRALDAVTAENPCPALDLTAWLQGAVRDGLVLGARLLHRHDTPLRSTP